MKVLVFVTIAVIGAINAQEKITTTPVPILKQINKVNEDGSYTYGYENADGSYKIETRAADGQTKGKYGYYDNEGTLREIEYGASRAGFYPTGTGINAPEVAPPRDDPNAPQDGSYDPELYTYPYQHGYDGTAQNQVDYVAAVRPPVKRIRVKTGRRVQNGGRQLSLYNQQYQQPQQQQQYQQPQQQQQYQSQQLQQYQAPAQQLPSYYQQQPQAPVFNQAELFQGHPARNIDLNTGSYSISYSG